MVPAGATKEALVGAIMSIDPAAGALEVTVRAGKGLIVGADPAGHETKNGVAMVTTAVADSGVSKETGAGRYPSMYRMKALCRASTKKEKSVF